MSRRFAYSPSTLAVASGAALALLALVAWWLVTGRVGDRAVGDGAAWRADESPLPAADAARFARWVDATGSQAVAAAWARARADGVVTEAERVAIEGVAASEPVPFGLGSPARD